MLVAKKVELLVASKAAQSVAETAVFTDGLIDAGSSSYLRAQ